MSSIPTAPQARAAPPSSRTFPIRIRAAWRDAAVVLALTALAAVVCVRLDVSEMVRRWTAPWESIQLDELPGILLVLAIALVWFAARRYLDAGRELRRRRVAEARAAAALADNRRLAQQHLRLQESERKVLARELHDELGQYLNVIKLDAVSIRDNRVEGAEALRKRAGAIVENCDYIHRALKALIRELRPVGLDELGLAAALEHCLHAWQARLAGTQLRLSVRGDVSQLSEAGCLTVYRLVQEALTNVAKHAAARHVEVGLARRTSGEPRTDAVVVTITDDGRGVDLAAPTGGLGLMGMRERVAALEGTLEVTSSPGQGLRLEAHIPLAAARRITDPQASMARPDESIALHE